MYALITLIAMYMLVLYITYHEGDTGPPVCLFFVIVVFVFQAQPREPK